MTPPLPPAPLVFRPDPPCQDNANERCYQGDESEEDEEGHDDDRENATQHDESQDHSNSSICSSDDDDHYEPSNEEHPEDGYTSFYTTAITSSYPSPKEVIYANGSFDDTEDRICNMLNSMSEIQMALAIKGKKVARERRMEKMRQSNGGNDKNGGGI